MGYQSPESAAPPLFLRRLIAVDATISQSLHTLTRSLTPKSLLLVLEFLADFRFTFPFLLSLFFVTPPSSPLRLHLLLPLILCSIVDLLFIAALKFLVRRSRPLYGNHDGYNAVVSVDHFSFPSGHSSRVFFTASLFYFSRLPILESLPDLKSPAVASFVCRWIGDDDVLVVDLLIFIVWSWAIATAFSRITLGRHYVLDVFVGSCLGVLEAFFTLRFLRPQLLS